jgi:hypothetical protein
MHQVFRRWLAGLGQVEYAELPPVTEPDAAGSPRAVR